MELILLLAAIALLGGAGGSASGGAGGSAGWVPPSSSGLEKLRAICRAAGLTEDQTAFLALVAKGESGWNNLRGLGEPSLFPPGTKPSTGASAALKAGEARAARAAYRQNQGKFESCPWPPEAYGFGSGGWFGMIPAYGLAQFPASSGLRCLPPSAVFDPVASVCMAIGFARGLQGWRGYKKEPTVLNLRLMWGNPSKGGDPERIAKRRGYYTRQAVAMGLPAAFVDRKLPRFLPGRDLGQLYYALGGSPP